MKEYIKQVGKVVPTIDGDWNINQEYENISIVFNNQSNKSYISKKEVPKGISILNKEYWQEFGNTRIDNDSILLLSYKDNNGNINSYTLEEAINSINIKDRRIGIFISFYEKPNAEIEQYRWNLYQFNSNNIDNFTDITAWDSIYYNKTKFYGLLENEDILYKVKKNPSVGDYAFVGTSLGEAIVYRCYTKNIWKETTEKATEYLTILIQGTVTVGPNGNWFNDGVDTNIPAKGEKGDKPYLRYNETTGYVEYSFDQENWSNLINKEEITGAAATIKVGTVSSLPAGSSPKIINSGTSSDAIFNFSIPKGDKGDKGDQGNSGVSGDVSDIIVINNLNGGESEEGNIKVLAAEQGKVLNEKLIELENNTNKIIFTDNTIANAFIKEINIKITDSKYVKLKLNFYNNFSGTTGIRIYGITEIGEETSLGTFPISTYYNEENNIFEVNNDILNFFAVIDWGSFVRLSIPSLLNIYLTEKSFNKNFCDYFILREHENNTKNPHKVTKEQIGLSNVDNTSDLEKPISKPQKEYINSELKEFIYSDNEDLNKGLFGLYLFPQSEYDSFKVTIFNGNSDNYLLRLVGVKDGVETNIKNFEKDSVVNNILKLDYWGYALINFSLFDKQYINKSDVFNTDEQHNMTLISLVNSNTELITTYIQAYSDTSFGVYENPTEKPQVTFVGIDAIARAINLYKDKGNALNKYVIKAHGLFVAKSAEQFTATDNGEYAIFALQSTNYISIQGDGIDATLVSAELPDDLGTSFRYDMYSPVIQNGNNSFITDMTISGINCRYTIHTDRSSTNKSDYYEQHIERCRLISHKNTGDAHTVWTSEVPHGIGISNGMKMYMEDCEIITDTSVLYVHSNAGFTIPFMYKCKNIKCIQKTDTSLKFAHVAAISAGIKGYFVLENVDGLGRFDYGESVRNPLPTDLADIVIKGNNNGFIGVVKPNIPKYQLRVSVNDTTIPHTIIYDKIKDAYNVIIKGTNLVGGNSDVVYQEGQAYKKGGVGFSAWCLGLLPVMETSQNINAKIGVRLGDCSSTNKVLGFIIDGSNYSITLDKDYTSMSNDDILSDFNAKLSVLSVPCTADLYSISAETYMDLDSVITLQNTSGKDIVKGLAVKRSIHGFDLAVNDSECIGILLDDVIVNGIARILTKGYISKYGGRYLIKTVGGALTANSRYGVNADSKLELNENGKFLAVNSDAVIF